MLASTLRTLSALQGPNAAYTAQAYPLLRQATARLNRLKPTSEVGLAPSTRTFGAIRPIAIHTLIFCRDSSRLLPSCL